MSASTAPTLKDLPPPPPGKTGWPWTEQSTPLPERMPDGSEWPRISIVTPNYNYGHFIEETIRSVLLQGYSNLEYIIMDGGSIDNSVEIIKRYERWITHWDSKTDNGQTSAINEGFKKVSGSILNWLNSDDLLMPNSLNSVSSLFALQEHTDWISGARIVKDTNGLPRDLHLLWPKSWALYAIGLPDFPQEATFFSSRVWNLVGGLREDLSCIFDVFYFYQVLSHTRIGILTSSPLSMSNAHPEQKTKSLATIGSQEFNRVMPEMLNNFERQMWSRLLRTRFHGIVMQILRISMLGTAKNKFKLASYNYYSEPSWKLLEFNDF